MLHHQEQWAKNKPMSASLKMYNMLRWAYNACPGSSAYLHLSQENYKIM